MVANQFATLISQTHQQSRGGLYSYIGQLLFQRAIHSTEIPSAKLLVQLCHSIFIKTIQLDSGIADQSQYIHERVFRLCIGVVESVTLEEHAAQDEAGPTNNGGTSTSILGSLEAGHISRLISDLYDFGLISVAQIFEYLSNLVISPAPIQARLVGLCELLETHSSTAGIGAEPWTEIDATIKWASDSISTHSVDEHTRGRVEVRSATWSSHKAQL